MRVRVAAAAWTVLSGSGETLFRAELGRARLPAGWAETEAWVADGSLTYDVGDVVVQLVEADDGRVWVHPPALVVTVAVRVPRGRGLHVQVLCRPAGLDAVPIGMATASFRAARVPSARPLAEGAATDPDVRRILLGLWALDEDDVSAARPPAAP